MPSPTERPAAALDAVLGAIGEVAVAVSGGVDSMTLAVVAGRRLGRGAEMLHAVSPAVPPEASARVRAYAAREGWRLEVIDAGEFADPDYLKNPANRCFFCKANLYGTIATRTAATICSGTNLDDLADWRPGLEAAKSARCPPSLRRGRDRQGGRARARPEPRSRRSGRAAGRPLPLEPARDRDRGHGRAAAGWCTRSSG